MVIKKKSGAKLNAAIIAIIVTFLFVLNVSATKWYYDNSNYTNHNITNVNILKATKFYQNGSAILDETSSVNSTIYWDNNGTPLFSSLDITSLGILTNLKVSGAISFTSGLNWTYLTNYPSSCSSGWVIKGLGDSPTCIDLINRSNYWLGESSFNTSIRNYIDSQDLVFNTSIATYVDNQDTLFNDSIKKYIDAQDTLFNNSIANYINLQDILFNNSITNYIDAQNILFNNSITTYIDLQDILFNNSIANWVSNNFILLTDEGNLNVNKSDYWDNLDTYNTTQFLENSGQFNIDETYLSSLFKTNYYNVTSVILVAGINSSSCCYVNDYNGATYNVSETTGSPGLDVRFNFSGVENFNEIILRVKTIGNTELTYLQIWDYNNSEWENYAEYKKYDEFSIIEVGVYDEEYHMRNNTVWVRLYHPQNGNNNHMHLIDWVAIANGPATFSTQELDPLSFHLHDINSPWMYNLNGNITFNTTKNNETIEAINVIFNNSIATYIDTQNSIYNSSAWGYTDALETDILGYSYYNLSDFDISDYSTTADILAFGYYNATDFVITDYFTKSQILNFGYYNTSDFSISDYFTKSEVLAFNYYNSSDFDITDYFTKVEILGFNYYNSSDFVISDYYTKSQINGFSFYNLSDFDISDYYTKTQTDVQDQLINSSARGYADSQDAIYNASAWGYTDALETKILGYSYYNISDFDINDYYTASEIEGFSYYNASDFDIADYYTKTEIENFNYYNLSDFDINDYYTKSQTDTQDVLFNNSIASYSDNKDQTINTSVRNWAITKFVDVAGDVMSNSLNITQTANKFLGVWFRDLYSVDVYTPAFKIEEELIGGFGGSYTKNNSIVYIANKNIATMGASVTDTSNVLELYQGEETNTGDVLKLDSLSDGGNYINAGDVFIVNKSGYITEGSISASDVKGEDWVENSQLLSYSYYNISDFDINDYYTSSDAATFVTVNTGHGDNELYVMNQDVQTTDDVTFNNITATAKIIQSQGQKHCFTDDCSSYIEHNGTALIIQG